MMIDDEVTLNRALEYQKRDFSTKQGFDLLGYRVFMELALVLDKPFASAAAAELTLRSVIVAMADGANRHSLTAVCHN